MKLTIFPGWFAQRDDATNILSRIDGFSPNIFKDEWVAFFDGPETKPQLRGFFDEVSFLAFYETFMPKRGNLIWLYNTRFNRYFEITFQPTLRQID